MDCLITLDAGTGSGRCVALDARGRVLAAAQAPFDYHVFTDPVLPMVRGFDLDAGAFWAVLSGCARRVMAALPATARVRAVVPTSQREGCVFLDASGEVLYAGPNLDARAVAEGFDLEATIGAARLHAVTGHAPPYIFPIARYLWFRKQPQADRLATILMLNDWIVYRLSGARTAEHSSASESMLYDVRRRVWATDLLAAVGLDAGVLPTLREAGSDAGIVHDRAADETGIPAGTPVLVGGPDTELALLGSGVCADDDVGVVLGTTTPVQQVISEPLFDPDATLWTSAHVLPGRWVLESNAGDTGGAYRWLLQLCFGATDDAAHRAAEDAMAAESSAPQPIVCHLGPAVFNLRGINPFHPAAMLFRFPLLPLDRPGRGAVLRAFLDSVAFAVRGNVEQIEAVRGRSVGRVRLSGGLSRVALLPGIIATALGRPVEIAAVPESASVGCAILGAVAAGLHPTVAAAVGAMTSYRDVAPDVAQVEAYAQHYAAWRAQVAVLQGMTL